MTWISILVGAFVFLYIFWKRLREDYVDKHILGTGFYVIIGVVLGYLTSEYFVSSWFWLTFIGFILGIISGVYRFKLRFFEIMEAGIKAALSWMSLSTLFYFLATRAFEVVPLLILQIIFIVIYLTFQKVYKHFSWYKSGRIGFAGLATVGLFFLTRMAIAIAFDNVISFVGKTDIFLSAIVAFTSFVALFNLANTKT